MPSNENGPHPLPTANGILDNEDSSIDPAFAAQVQKKYIEERDKRIRKDALDQFTSIEQHPRFQQFAKDVWDEQESRTNGHTEAGLPIKNGASCFVLIIGAGYGGICAAIRLVNAGVPVEQICIVDTAAGFGGTWYWNRYPGLMCDIESYVYMPFLEETGWMPKHKYSYGPELREYAEVLVDKWGLRSRALLRTKVESAEWNETAKHWGVRMFQNGNPFSVNTTFIIPGLGVLSTPQFPLLDGIDQYKGHMFHTSRWDYKYTGGSPSDPSMVNLKDKRVGIIGTGATAVQCVPHLARWSEQLHIFQRTPSAVDRRDQSVTDPEVWKKQIAAKEGWQRRRQNNFNKFVMDAATHKDEDLVNDGWTKARTFSVLVGGTHKLDGPIEEENEKMLRLDVHRQERIRKRVDEIVKDNTTSENLKAWYNTFCKRPCFHDDFLPTFNQPNVHLVDTDGQGVDRITEKGVMFRGKEYEFDLLIFATGFTSPFVSATKRSGIRIIGREGLTIDESWQEHGTHTLHGVLSRGFPNLCLLGPMHVGGSANFIFTVDQLGQHVAYIISKCYHDQMQRGRDPVKAGLEVEPTKEAEQEWGDVIASTAALYAPIAACTPGYINRESAAVPSDAEEIRKLTRSGPYGLGIDSFLEKLDKWRAKGDMQGVEVRVQ